MDQTNRYEREISSNRDSLRLIANTVNQKLQQKLTKPQVADLLGFVRGHSTQKWAGLARADICKALARTFLASRFTEKGRANIEMDEPDIHEIMKSHVGTTDQEPDYDVVTTVDANGVPIILGESNKVAGDDDSGLGSLNSIKTVDQITSVVAVGNIAGFIGKTDENAIQQMLNPKAAYRKNYILLDTKYRDVSHDVPGASSIGTISWTFLANTATAANGGINSLGDIQQVVAMSTGNIRLPYQNNVLINSYKRVSLLVNEWSGQAFIGQEGRKFHLMFSADIDVNMIDCGALPRGQAKFEFAKPITQLDTITITFGCPLEPITFDMDRQVMSVTYSNPARLSSIIPHNLQTGDQIYISGFTTANPATDNLIVTQMNSPTGYNAVVVDTTTIEIQIDLTAITTPINPLSCPVFFGSKRIFVPLELTYIAQKTKTI